MKKIKLNGIFFLFAFLLLSCSKDNTTTNPDNNTVPSAPANLKLSPSANSVTVSWDTTANTQRYNLYYSYTSPFSKTTATRIVNVLSPFLVSGLNYAKPIYFAVTSENSYGESVLSEIKTLTLDSPLTGKWKGNSDTVSGMQVILDLTLNFDGDKVTGTGVAIIKNIGTGLSKSNNVNVSGTLNGTNASLTLTSGEFSAEYSGVMQLVTAKVNGTIKYLNISYPLILQKYS